jgi:hypothetical protein
MSGGYTGKARKPHHNGNGAQSEEESARREGLLGSIGEHYADELNKLQGLAIGVIGAVVREMVTSWSPPALTEQITDVVDSLTTKLGGKTIHGPLYQAQGATPPPPWWPSKHDRSNVEPLTP